MTESDLTGLDAIAARVRRLVFGSSSPQFGNIARRLSVAEIALRRTAHVALPSPDPDVLAAIVKEYGVDPTWLLTGEYDGRTHARALEATSRNSLAGRFRATLARRRSVAERWREESNASDSP